MTPIPNPRPEIAAADDARVLQALEEYTTLQQAGRAPDRRAFLASHAEIAAVLADCLDGLEFVDAVAPQLRAAEAESSDLAQANALCLSPLGDYQIVREIGRGGMGVVYEAVQLSLGRRVALKVLPFASSFDGRQLQRFKNEAHAAAQLHHPNIVPVFDVGCTKGVHYYAMQFIEGSTLAAFIQGLRRDKEGDPERSPTTVRGVDPSPGSAHFRTAARLGVQAANALEYAHVQGVVHRDIKPANLIVDGAGNLWITDFGLAQFQGGAGLTLPGDLLGTLRYMSPEQALAQPHLVDHRADIYSLGATLYELLTLASPYDGNDRQELLRQIAFDEPRPFRKVNDRVPVELATIVLKSMAKEAARRYATANEMADDLQRYLEDKPILAKPPTLREKLSKWSRRHKTIVRAAGLMAAVLISALFVATWLIWESRQDAVHQRDTADEQRLRAEREELNARRHLYAANMQLAAQAAEKGQIGDVLTLLDEQRPGPNQEDLRGFEWYYLWRACHPGLVRTIRNNAAVTTMAVAPTGQWLAWGGIDSDVKVFDLRAGKIAMTLRGHSAQIASLAFSPDGKKLATGSHDRTVKLWDLVDGKEPITFQGHPAAVRAVAYSPDGGKLASADAGGGIRLWDPPAGLPVGILPGHDREINSLAFSPNGDLLASGGGTIEQTGEVKLWNLAKHGEPRTIQGHRSRILSLAFASDGKTLATSSDDWTIKTWDALTGSEESTIDGPGTGGVRSVSYSREGRWMAWGSSGGQAVLLDRRTGRTRVQGHHDAVASVALSPDEKLLVSASEDGTVKLWDLSNGMEEAAIDDAMAGANAAAFSPDGQTLAVGARDGTVALWSTDAWERRKTIQANVGEITALAYSPRDCLAAAGKNGKIQLGQSECWEKDARAFVAHEGAVRCLAFSSDGLALASGGDDGMVKTWAASSGDREGGWSAHRDGVSAVCFAPNSNKLASGGKDGSARLWDPRTGQERTAYRVGGRPVFNLAFSPDGAVLAVCRTGSAPNVFLCNVTSGNLEMTLKGHVFTTRAIAFLPDGRTVLTGGSDQTIKTWDLATGQERASLKAPSGYVAAVALSPNGRTAVSISLRGAVKLWRTTSDQEIAAQEKQEP